MFKIFLKGGVALEITVTNEYSKLTAKEFFAKLRAEKKRWYECENDIVFTIEDIVAIQKKKRVKKKENETSDGGVA